MNVEFIKSIDLLVTHVLVRVIPDQQHRMDDQSKHV